MSVKSSIEWTDSSWSPLRARVKQDAARIAEEKGYTALIQIAGKMAGHVGPHCEHVSHGCTNCYAETNNHRCLSANGTGLPFDRRSRDLVEPFVDEKVLVQPLHWKKPRRIFVENQSDLFGEWNSDEMIDRVFAVMALCPQHTFQVLTKRPEPARRYVAARSGDWLVPHMDQTFKLPVGRGFPRHPESWPLPNVHLGISCENQQTADERIPLLLQTPAAVRFISYEPALGPVDIIDISGVDWVIAGGESGPGARPAHPQWFRDVRDQCHAAGVPFLFKQWGAYSPVNTTAPGHTYPKSSVLLSRSGQQMRGMVTADLSDQWMHRVGKKAAGRLLDGHTWDEFPAPR